VLTPLLALLLAREGLPVLIHGTATESSRIVVRDVLQPRIDGAAETAGPIAPAAGGPCRPSCCPGLKRLLDVRRVVGLRNSARTAWSS
jgi:anthranilate phosphoribosyltransferase